MSGVGKPWDERRPITSYWNVTAKPREKFEVAKPATESRNQVLEVPGLTDRCHDVAVRQRHRIHVDGEGQFTERPAVCMQYGARHPSSGTEGLDRRIERGSAVRAIN
jgi:hypothetical protein